MPSLTDHFSYVSEAQEEEEKEDIGEEATWETWNNVTSGQNTL